MARHFHLDKGTIARTVRKMEDAGYVTRVVDPLNRRAFILSLTDKGRSIAPEIIAIDREWQRSVLSVLTGEEQELLFSFLGKVTSMSISTVQQLERES